jgi:hypothetical protein
VSVSSARLSAAYACGVALRRELTDEVRRAMVKAGSGQFQPVCWVPVVAAGGGSGEVA